jgi:hypothetical protein
MPNVQIPPGLSESDDVDHDQTQGGTEGNPHGDSAASADVSSIQSSADVDHDNTSGGTAGNPHSSSASTNHGNDAHSDTFETTSGAQSRVNSHENKNNPHSSSASTNHGNGAHNANFETDSGAQSRVDSHENKNNPHSSSASNSDVFPYQLVVSGTVGVPDDGPAVGAFEDNFPRVIIANIQSAEREVIYDITDNSKKYIVSISGPFGEYGSTRNYEVWESV